METIIHDQTPLAEYLTGQGEADNSDWAVSEHNPDSSPPVSLPSSPCFAPSGRPALRPRFRSKLPDPLTLDITGTPSLRRLRSSYSSVVTSRIDRADTSKFLEQFRYAIVASQLLSGHSILGQYFIPPESSPINTADGTPLEKPAAIASTAGTVGVAFVITWLFAGGYANLSRRRVIFVVTVVVVAVLAGPVYFKRQWLKFRRDQAVSGVTTFISQSQDLDGATGAALALIQEVELVSRGYRISTPLPPISRIEDRSQARKCVRLRKALYRCFAELIPVYHQTSSVVRAFSEQLDLEKYYDIYDISDFDISDALQSYSDDEFDDTESLRTLKILAARFHTIRKIFLCGLLALDANGDTNDLLRWTTAVEALSSLNTATGSAYEKLREIMSIEEAFPTPPTPKLPLTPGRERWRSQLRKLNSLSTGIRGLQAKLQLLREESDRVLDDSNGIPDLGPSLMAQYESIGVDLKDMMQAWEEGKAALALGIDRNEKRLSSMSTLFSPSSSVSGLTTVDEGGDTTDALKKLNGDSLSPSSQAFTNSDPDAEVFEAVALPRPRSLLTRDERIIKMREERERKEVARDKAEATRGMLRELEMVINLRPKGRTSAPGMRVTSL